MSDVIVIDTNDVVAVETPSEIILEVSGPQGPAGANLDWDTLPNKPATFTPSTHSHPASQITDFATEVAAVAPPTTNAGLLTSGTLLDARLSTVVTTSLGKADTASQPGHTHTIANVTDLQTALNGKQAIGSYAASSHVHSAATTTVAGFLSTADKTKLDGIATGAGVNVNADWTAPSGDAAILNKPFVPAASSTTPQPSGPAVVGTSTAFARGDHRHAHYTVFSDEVSGTTQSTPQIISISQAQLPAKIILSHDEPETWTEISLPYMSNVFQGNFDTEAARSVDPVVVIRNYNMGGGGSVRLRVAVGQGEAVYPASGFDDVVFLTDYVFRWNGRFWDMDLRVPEGDTITVGQVFKPRHSGVLAAFTDKPITATSSGVVGQLAWGYDDGAERLYICVATNNWRRATIATWS